MILSRQNIRKINELNGLIIPDEKIFSLPEKALQFGTGVLLRGLPDYFIDKANRQGVFNGRIVVVKSTSNGGTDEFGKQDSLYTLCVKGIEHGNKVEETILNSSISRVISANDNWPAILECAYNPEMRIIISNTTEVGIMLMEDDIRLFPPHSFPGKLLAFLYERYKAFKGSKESGMVIIPTELITDNGQKLRSIVIELARMNKLNNKFIDWVKNENHFCNSLVDRIVPGKLSEKDKAETEMHLGYKDDLMIMAESFRLWAIESDNERIRQILSFGEADKGVVMAPNIEIFRELKLRLLNGTHTFNCGTAFLSGFDITRDAMNHPVYGLFTKKLMHNEISPAIPFTIDKKTKEDFANKVFERFCNPFIDHQWQSITLQYTSKMKMRNVPLLLRYYELNHSVPLHMATGFAAFLLYMKVTGKAGNKFFGERKGIGYEIKDDSADYFNEIWHYKQADEIAEEVMSNGELWETDLTQLPGFLQTVQEQLKEMLTNGVLQTILQLENKKVTV